MYCRDFASGRYGDVLSGFRIIPRLLRTRKAVSGTDEIEFPTGTLQITKATRGSKNRPSVKNPNIFRSLITKGTKAYASAETHSAREAH